jgi:hypothetical protein
MPLVVQATGPVKRTKMAAAAGGDWQLAEGHFIPAKMTPIIIHPRPDAEMAAYARAARAPSAIAWGIPIVVRGGAWPFKYELVTGPSGMAMTRETLPSDWLTNGAQGYGILAWSSPTVGSHDISVKVTDQDGTEVTRDWTLEVIDRENTSYFVFMDATSGSDSNSGAYSSPMQTIQNGWYENAKTDSTHQNKQVFYRAGTYSTYVNTGASGQMDLTTSKPAVHVGYPGESVTIDCDLAFWDFESMTNGDVCFANLSFVNPQTGTDPTMRKQFIRISYPAATRRVMYDNYYDGGGDTQSDDGSNSSCVMNAGAAASGTDYYGSDTHCTFHQCDNMDFVLMYESYDHVIEFNLITGGYGGTYNPSWGFFIKGNGNERYSIRANRAIDGTISRPLVHCSEFTSHLKGDVEVCWNNFRNTAASGNGVGCIRWGQGSTGQNYGNFWSYRNNLRDAYIDLIGIDVDGYFEFENDVHEHNGTYTDGFTFTDSDFATPPPTFVKTDLATGTSMVDGTTNLLTGTPRTTYLGTHGCEVA